VLEALARTNYTTLVSVYDYVDVEEMRPYVARNGDLGMETPKATKPNAVGNSALGL